MAEAAYCLHMTLNQAVPFLFSASLMASHAGIMETSAATDTFAPEVDVFRAAAIQTGGMDIDGDDGELALTRFEFRAILSEPISVLNGLTIVPVLSYSTTMLDFDGTTGGFPIEDEDLHSIALSAFFIQEISNSKWFAAGWTRVEMATDFQHINGDDFDFDIAGGLAYRFNDRFTLGFGAVALSLNGDTTIIPGIGFDWTPCEKVRVGLYGPNFLASYSPNDQWEFSVRGEPGGGDWNIRDKAGDSRTIDLTSYRIGLHAQRRITNDLWFGAGVGMTVANEIELRDQRGGNSFDRDLDGSLFGQVTLSLHRW